MRGLFITEDLTIKHYSNAQYQLMQRNNLVDTHAIVFLMQRTTMTTEDMFKFLKHWNFSADMLVP